MAKIDVTIAKMLKDIEYLLKEQKEMQTDFKEFMKNAGKKFARKWTERAIYWFAGTLIASFITVIILLLTKQS